MVQLKDLGGCEMIGYIKSLRKYVGHNPLIQCGASVIILDADGKVLMIHRTDNDCWCFPGGGVDINFYCIMKTCYELPYWKEFLRLDYQKVIMRLLYKE